MRHELTARFALFLVGLGLAACGGEGAIFQEGGAPGQAGPQLSRLAELLIFPSDTQLANNAANPGDGDAGVSITVVAVDANRNVLSGVPVQLTAVDSSGAGDGVITIPVDDDGLSLTGPNGTVVGTLTTGGDESSRTIRVTATAGNVNSETLAIEVVDPAAIGGGANVANLELLASDTQLPQDLDPATEGVTLTAIVTDENGNLVPGVNVTFTVNGAALRIDRATTDNSGTASAQLSTGGVSLPGPVTVTAFVNGQQGVADSVTVNVVERTVGAVTLLPSAQQLRANGTDTVTLRVLTLDTNNFTLPGVPVLFQSDFGTLSVSGTTRKASALRVFSDQDGNAVAQLSTLGDFTDTTDFSNAQITVTMTIGSPPNVTTRTQVIDVIDPDAGVELPPAQNIAVRLSSDTLPANATSLGSGVGVTAVVTTDQGVVVPDVPVTFSLNFSSNLQSSRPVALQVTRPTTDGTGTATGTLLARTNNVQTGSVTITASAEGVDGPITGGATLRLVEAVGVIELQSSTNFLEALANNSAQITAFARDANGQPLSGVEIAFAASSGTLNPGIQTTDSNGQATTTLSIGGNTTPRTISVSASTAGLASSSVNIAVSDPVGSVQLTSDVAILEDDPADPDNVANLTARILDEDNAPLEGIPVVFEILNGSADVSAVIATTGAEGVATATLRTNALTSVGVGAVVVRASAGGQSAALSFEIIADPEPNPPTPQLLTLVAGGPSLGSNADTAAEGLTLTAIVRDSTGVLLSNQNVSFAVVGGNAAILVQSGTTNANGVATAVLTTAGDPTDRQVTVNATSGAATDSIQIQIQGTTLTLSGPTSIGDGDDVTLSARLVNAGGEGIANTEVTLSVGAVSDTGTIAVSPTSVRTDSSGRVEFTVTGIDAGTATLTATALGEGDTLVLTVAGFSLSFGSPLADAELDLAGANETVSVRLEGDDCLPVLGNIDCNGALITFSTTRGRFVGGPPNNAVTMTAPFDLNGDGDTADPGEGAVTGVATISLNTVEMDGAGPVTVLATGPGGSTATLQANFVAVTPDTIEIQAEPDTVPLNGQAQIEVRVRDMAENPVKNQVVDFQLTDPTNGALSAASATTDRLGRAFVTYNATELASAQNGVRVTATLQATPAISASVDFTVSGNALSIEIGTGNELQQNTITSYALPFSVIVTDGAGNPAPPSTVFRLSYEPLVFGKGFYECPIPDESWIQMVTATCNDEDEDNDFILDMIADEDGNNDGFFDDDLNRDFTCDVDEVTMGGAGTDDNSDGFFDCDLDLDGVADPAELGDANMDGFFDVDANMDGVADPGEGGDANGDGFFDADINRNRSADPAECGDAAAPFGIFDADIDGDGQADAVDEGCIGGLFPSDTNMDGLLTVREDRNQDGSLTPGNIATIPSTIELDENGFGEFNIIYAEQYANWVTIRLRATASVGGTETTAVQTFTLPGIVSDFKPCGDVNAPGNPSPFGVAPTCFTAD